MRVVLQRVTEASVVIDGKVYSEIGQGVMILLGIETEDGIEDMDWLISKISSMRIFNDDDGKMNLSIQDIKGQFLVVSQFTLHASTKKGNRPSYIRAARPEQAVPLYQNFISRLEDVTQTIVKTGVFGADMKIQLINDGPVTIIIDSKNKE